LKGGKQTMNKKAQSEGTMYFALFVIVVIGCIAMAFIMPVYNVWAQGMSGKADLREAEWNRQIAIAEAEAEMESATLKKQAEIIRAEGIAEANKIIAGSITPEYIRYKFIEGLNDGNTEVIYVPTEANLPILEARDVRIPS